MQWQKWIWSLGMLWLGLGMLAGVQAMEVVALGRAEVYGNNTGGARNQALQNAQRQAIEQTLGALIDSQTISQNFQIIKDEILSVSKGFVSQYEILKEGMLPDGSAYEVQIKAQVQEQGIADKLTALRLLHKKMGNKRLMVIYGSKDKQAMSRTHGAVQSTLGAIRDAFNQAGFRVFNEEAMTNVYTTIEQAGVVDRPVESLIALALDQHAEILVQFEMIGGKTDRPSGAFYATRAMVRMSVFDVTTGQQIADVQTNGKELSAQPPGPYDQYAYISKAGQKAGKDAATQAIEKITAFYQNVGDQGFAYLMVFRNFSQDEGDDILNYLENTPGFKQLSELKNSPNYLEVELFSGEEKSRLRRKIRQDLKTQGLEVTTQETAGNRLIFLKSGTVVPQE